MRMIKTAFILKRLLDRIFIDLKKVFHTLVRKLIHLALSYSQQRLQHGKVRFFKSVSL